MRHLAEFLEDHQGIPPDEGGKNAVWGYFCTSREQCMAITHFHYKSVILPVRTVA